MSIKNPVEQIEQELDQLHIDLNDELVKEQAIFQTLVVSYKLQMLQYIREREILELLKSILAAVSAVPRPVAKFVATVGKEIPK